MDTKQTLPRHNLRYLLALAWRQHPRLYFYYLLNIVLTLVFTLSGLFAPRFLIAELTGARRVEAVLVIAGLYFVAAAGSGFLLAYIKTGYEYILAKIRYHFIRATREKIMRVQYKNMEDPAVLDNFWRVLSATSDVEFGVYGILIQTFALSANIVTGAFLLGILGSLSLWLILALAAGILVVFFSQSAANRYKVEHSRKRSPHERRERYLTNTMGDLTYGKDIRVFGLSNFLLRKLTESHAPTRQNRVEIETRFYWSDLVGSAVTLARDGLVYGYLIAQTLAGRLSVADFSMYFMSVAALTLALEQVFGDISFIRSDVSRIAELRVFLELPDEDAEESGTLPIPPADTYMLEFASVCFRYPRGDAEVLKDFSLKIESGKKLAVVGINGAGKTTLVKLITRLYEPDSGEILLNGVDIRRFKLDEYRRLLSVIFQDINIFALTMEENIAGPRAAEPALLARAVENAGLASIVAKLEKGVEAPMTRYLYEDGVELSGGEKQKIGIARALCQEGRVMVFDEPTSALDAHSEYDLYNKLAELSQGRTLLFISHRLATTRFCDAIALMDGGRVTELGSHEELMARQGAYYQMFQSQKQYYEEGGETV